MDISRKNRLKGSICFLSVLALWCGLSYTKLVDPIFLPTPTKVFYALWQLFNEHNFLYDVSITTSRVLSGFICAAVFAIPVGIGMSNWKLADEIFRPFAAFNRYLPVSAFIPLLILWVGIGFGQKVWVIFLGVFFHLVILIADDASRVPREIIDTATNLRAKKIHLAIRVRFPHSLPSIFDDMRVMLGAAWTYLIVAELVAANSGIGNMMIESQRFLKTDRVIAGVITVGVIGLASDFAFRAFGKMVMPWTRVKTT